MIENTMHQTFKDDTGNFVVGCMTTANLEPVECKDDILRLLTCYAGTAGITFNSRRYDIAANKILICLPDLGFSTQSVLEKYVKTRLGLSPLKFRVQHCSGWL